MVYIWIIYPLMILNVNHIVGLLKNTQFSAVFFWWFYGSSIISYMRRQVIKIMVDRFPSMEVPL